jgi:hypothetical protein
MTCAPPAGAGPFKVTVAVEEVPPATLAGLSDTLLSVGALMVKVAVCGPLKLPVIVAVVVVPTATVPTANVIVVAPPGTVTLLGTVAAAWSLDRATTAPPAGAALLSVTVPVEGLPPTNVAGLSDTLLSVGALMVKVAVCGPLKLPVIVAVVVVPTATVPTVNVAVSAPPGTVTLLGTVAAAWSLDRVTTAPPAGAGLLRVTVPVEGLPPTNAAGLSDTDESVGGLIVRVPASDPL